MAILGVGATQQALAFNEEGEVVQKDYLPLSLSFDHQVIDGLPAAEFLARVVSYLEDPYLLYLLTEVSICKMQLWTNRDLLEV